VTPRAASPAAPRAPTIGLTGGIGSGKSTVGRALAALGAHLVDTDAIAHRLTAAGGAALPAIAEAFGEPMLDAHGALDRARMRAIVFAQPAARLRLESILHPMIGEQTRQEAAAAAPGQVVVFDVPLLAESERWRQRVDRVLVVDCDEALQVQRVRSRNGWSEAQVLQIIGQQASRQRRRSIADAVIVNGQLSLEELDAEIMRLWRDWFHDLTLRDASL
jgi:dephospho-CoA kinase